MSANDPKRTMTPGLSTSTSSEAGVVGTHPVHSDQITLNGTRSGPLSFMMRRAVELYEMEQNARHQVLEHGVGLLREHRHDQKNRLCLGKDTRANVGLDS